MECIRNSPIGSAPLWTNQEVRAERRLPYWLTGTRAERVGLLLVGVWLINAFDLMLTILAVQQGILQESNPIAAWVIPLGPSAVTFFKIALLLPPSAVLLKYRRQFISEIAVFGIFLIYVTVAIRWRMVYELYLVNNAHDYYSIPLLDRLNR